MLFFLEELVNCKMNFELYEIVHKCIFWVSFRCSETISLDFLSIGHWENGCYSIVYYGSVPKAVNNRYWSRNNSGHIPYLHINTKIVKLKIKKNYIN